MTQESIATADVSPDYSPDSQTEGQPELVGPLEKAAYQVAQTQGKVVVDERQLNIDSRLKQLTTWLEDAHAKFAGAQGNGSLPSYAAEWILDNFYVIQQALRQIKEDLPERYYAQLPKLPAEWVSDYAASLDDEKDKQEQTLHLAGVTSRTIPRILALAYTFLRQERCQVDSARLERYLKAYQTKTPLTMGEIWALPIMLRLALLEILASAAGKLVGLSVEPSTLVEVAIATLHHEEAVAHTIPSLRTLDSQSWPLFFEDVSLVHQMLADDPMGVYLEMDFDTRNRYREEIEALAFAVDLPEIDIAKRVLQLANDAYHDVVLTNKTPGANGQQRQIHAPMHTMRTTHTNGSKQAATSALPREAHVGFYLIDAGRETLEHSIGYQLQGMTWLRRQLLRWPTSIYLGTIVLLTVLMVLLVIWYAGNNGGGLWAIIGLTLLAAIPASTVAINLINELFTRILPPRTLPKLDFQEGIPADARTMVVVPALLSQLQDVDSLCSQLELHYLRCADGQIINNPDELSTPNQITFALLTDYGDAPEGQMAEDRALIEDAITAIEALNKKYADRPFYLFHRYRLWNESEGVWMGWERKRGKLHEFNRLLRGDSETTYSVQVGDLSILPEVRYVITLDADTLLPRGEAHRLIGTLAHPLNQATFNAAGKVVSGYTILQPRTEITPTSSNQSIFSRIFSGDTGFDLYTRAVSDIYQDLFGTGIFVGKGIYDVDAFERSLAERVPENTILSHDLFEGIHGRAALVTDVVLYEDYPPHYLVNVRRSHRWVRGDWQLLPWLFPRVPADDGAHGRQYIANDLSPIARWMIFDNLRRSLFAPALLLFLVLGWTILPGAAWAWTVIAVFAPSVPLLTSLLNALVRLAKGDDPQQVAQSLRYQAFRWVLFLAFLPYESLLLLDAVTTTLVRLYIRRRRLLRWVTAERTARLFGDEMSAGATLNTMLSSLLFVVALIFLLLWVAPHVLPIAAPLLAMWLFSWWIVHSISLPEPVEPVPLTQEQRQTMRLLARRTWLFYEHFVGPDDNWLPPDHYQENPNGVVAHRTSPTNSGMYLLSALAAYDMGYIGVLNLIARFDSTFATFDRLERYRGHFWNWIDTRTLAPLPPRYVSTVDSGNLAGALIAMKQGVLHLDREDILVWTRWQGVIDLLLLLDQEIAAFLKGQSNEDDNRAMGDGAKENSLRTYLTTVIGEIETVRTDPLKWPPLVQRLAAHTHQTINEQLMQALQETSAERHENDNIDVEKLHTCRIFSERIQHHLDDMQRDITTLLPWYSLMAKPPAFFMNGQATPAVAAEWKKLQALLTPDVALRDAAVLFEIAQPMVERIQLELDDEANTNVVAMEARNWSQQLLTALNNGAKAASNLITQAKMIADRANTFVTEMDFRFLFNKHRQVFHIGYNIDAGRLDQNYYDLLASEARVASLLAIAKRDVPQSHWLHLGRPMTQTESGERVLLSWSGTMFEYLMPPLLLRGYRGALLDQSCRASVEQQIIVGHLRNKPWGISESGFYTFDAAMNYQYRAFGAPGLGFKRGLDEDQVVAPYASLMAVAYRPQAVWKNLQQLNQLDMMGRYGLYEAIDFTPAHLNLGQDHAIVRSYMAHHQGMIFVALLNYLQDQPMIKRFHADPYIQSVDLLLQEGLPAHAPLQFPHQDEGSTVVPEETSIAPIHPWPAPVDTPMPLVHYLSNGHYSTLITNSGGGFSRCDDIQLTRWRADTTLDDWGCWVYLQELATQKSQPEHESKDDAASYPLWSVTRQPLNLQPEFEEVTFHPHMAEFRRRSHNLTVQMEVTIAPSDNIEVRRITLTNESDRPRRFRLTSYGEVVLGSAAGDERHQAFAKLFVESEYLADLNALLFRRRPRAAEEPVHFLLHALVTEPSQTMTATAERAYERAYESDRARFLGRGHDTRHPQSLRTDEWLTGTTGATLDPIMALGQEIELDAHATTQVVLLTATADDREMLMDLGQRYQQWGTVSRVYQEARNIANEELRELGLTEARLETVQKLLSLLLYPHHFRRPAADVLAANRKGQSGLWAYGISGDYPILLVRIQSEDDGELLQEVLRAHRYWRRRGLQIDVVILNRQSTNYGQPVQGFVQRAISHMESNQWLNRRGGLFVVRADQLNESDRVLLQTTARVVLDADNGLLSQQLAGMLTQPTRLPAFSPALDYAIADTVAQRALEAAPSATTDQVARPTDLQFDNGFGGFNADGTEYVIYQKPGEKTPAPWINVIANAEFGTIVSETGGGYTWSINSGENRLTTWRNDPVSDKPAEALYLRDEQSAAIWSPTPLPAPAAAPYRTRHGAGYSIFEHQSHALKQQMTIFVAPDAPIKLVQLRLENQTDEARRITATYYAELVLGVQRSQSSQFIIPSYDEERNALLFRNPYNTEFGNRVAFVAGSQAPHGVTTDRTEFLGRLGSLARPAALGRIGLSGRVQVGVEPCAALQLHIDLPPNGVQEIFFLIGQGENRQEATALIERFQQPSAVNTALQDASALWDEILGTITVKTPDPAMNLLLNRWLLYQALSCRIWGRSALYQSSGAYGFRDQLQDSMALIHARPDLVRQQLLRSARHQFEAGDVLHWWHPPGGQGVRTRITDDLLWLPFVTAHYVAATGDLAVLKEEVPFLHGTPLSADEEERYAQYESTDESASLYTHCLQALRKGTTAGRHGIPLMGAGDWNDGMNRVGIEGKGESIWLGWFLYTTQMAFAKLCDAMDDSAEAEQWRQRAADIAQALDAQGWDGNWYRRAYYDDGTPLGSAENEECRIDSIAQSWSVISGAARPDRAEQAMQAVLDHLVNWQDRLILLFTPPLDKTPNDPGYIKGYLPGIRENGGQYTHAALWAIWAFTELGDGETAGKLFQLINPILRADTVEKADHYKVEPYVIAADVYGVNPHNGRGGWTWYTGSSGWMYRLGIEAILGLRRVADGLQLRPCLPPEWPGYEATYQMDFVAYHITVERDTSIAEGEQQIVVNDKPISGDVVPAVKAGQEETDEVAIVVRIGAS